ncbi:MAG: cysteine desulfurase [Erysipelotrichaceae bacterium]|nr:cysteine desulfurase [Erysipelotrichaceae bacterium]
MFDINKVRNDFPMIRNNPNLIYFDSSATSFKPQCVIDAINKYYSFDNVNIHRGDYDISYRVSKAYEDTRKNIAKFINADDERCIIYTNGATSSLNLLAYGYGKKYLKKGDVILTSYVEHASSILPWFNVCKETGASIKYVPLNADGSFNIDKYKECFNDNIKIVALPYVSNVLGYIYPAKEIINIAHKYNAIVSLDGAQAVPHIKVDVSDLDVDFLSFSSHKMLGPAGVGVLYGKYELLDMMDPLYYGGDSNARFDIEGNLILKNIPYKFESGTPCIEGILGLNSAINYLNEIGIDNIAEYDEELTKYLIDKLSSLNNVTVYNSASTTGIVTFNVNGVFAQDAASYFNKNSIAVRSGNHCAKLLHNVIGINDTIRASLYFYNSKEEIDKFIDIVKDTTIEKCVESIL